MVQRVEVIIIDDIDGSPADETLKFTLDGTSYEIDLSTANAARLREALAPFVGSARATSARRGRTKAPAKAGATAAQIRVWAAASGHQISDRGRVPTHIRQAFELAHA